MAHYCHEAGRPEKMFGMDRGGYSRLMQTPLFANWHPIVFLLIATTLEVSGDAVVRLAIHEHTGAYRLALFGIGTALLLGYGTFLNLAPLEFGQVVGLYIATLFVVWQVINFLFFRTLPTLPVLAGGALIVAGGLIVSFWKTTPPIP
jgi:small multidrug resistance family-3 protein